MTGEVVTGELETHNISDVVQFLRNRDVIPLDIEEVKSKFDLVEFFTSHHLQFFKVGDEELLIFCRQMATLTGAGVSLVTSLQQLSLSAKSKVFARALADINKRLAAGQSLAKSISAHRNIFSPIVISIVETGENTGSLKEAFQQLTSYFENEIVNRRRIKSATRYPIMVVVASLVALFIINIFVIPQFTAVFANFGLNLPLATRILIKTSTFISQHWLLLLIAAAFLFFGRRYLFLIPGAEAFWDRYKLSIPVFGNLQRKIIIARFAWACGLILRSGVNIGQAIQLAAHITNNLYLSKKMLLIRDEIEQGKSFTQAVSQSELFPLSAVQMISVGEETGGLENMLNEIAKSYNEEIDFDMRRLNELLQPILLVVAGVMVLVVAIGIYLPLWDLAGGIK